MVAPKVRSTRRRSLVTAVASTLIAVAAVAPRPATAAPTPTGDVADWTTTTGTDGRVYMADANGRALQFHGFNHKTDDPATLTDELLAAGAERGMDHVRLAVYWDRFEATQDVWDEAYLGRVGAAMDRAEAHGLRVILDMHQDVFGARFGGAGIPDWATRDDGVPFTLHDVWLLNYLEPAVQNAFEHLYEDADLRAQQVEAWSELVQRFSDHPALFGYDLLNEPFGKIRPGEDLLSAAARVESEQLTPMYQRLTDAISAIDPDHWVFIEPPNLASLGVPTSLGRVDGPKVAVYPHMYDPNIESATYTPGGVIEYDPTFFPKWADAITTYTDRYPVPMLVGEWGVARPELPGMDAFVADSLETLDRVSSGWSVFNWCMGSGYCPLDAAGDDRPGIGQIFQPYARAIAGAPTSTSWNPDAKVLTLRFADNGATGTTDIHLAADRAFPGGWTVATSDAEGTWSSEYDEATGVLSVTTPDTGGDHVICVQPEGVEAACAADAVDPVDPSDPTDPTTPTAPGATPIGGTGTYTG